VLRTASMVKSGPTISVATKWFQSSIADMVVAVPQNRPMKANAF